MRDVSDSTVAPRIRPVGVDELCRAGLSVATASAYARLLDRVAALLDERRSDRPELVVALADALHAGVAAPVPSARLGPWIEQPFRQWLQGEDPDRSVLRGPLLSVT